MLAVLTSFRTELPSDYFRARLIRDIASTHQNANDLYHTEHYTEHACLFGILEKPIYNSFNTQSSNVHNKKLSKYNSEIN